MEAFLEKTALFNNAVNDFVWIKSGLVLLLFAGVFTTAYNRFFQIKYLKHWWGNTFLSIFKKKSSIKRKDKKSISPFAALCTALAATIGTGNIAGVASAICIGGAGAVFWMWVSALFGMMTNYSENVLGIYFRKKNKNGEWSGGAMYYLLYGLGSKKNCKVLGSFSAILFSLFTVLASFGIGSMGQVNKMVANIQNAFDIKTLYDCRLFGDVSLYSLILGFLIMIISAAVLLGGLKRTAAVAEKAIPFTVILFTVGSLFIIAVNYKNILPAFKAIFVTAFKPVAAAGGTAGYLIKTVITQGFKRGIFSNEAGLGSSVTVHSSSSVFEPAVQGMWGIFEVFTDTFLVCTLTALVILTSGVYNFETGLIKEGLNDATLVADIFNGAFPWHGIGSKFVAVLMFLFAFTTILGWSHYGAKAFEYLFGEKSVIVFRIVHILSVLSGALISSSLAWDICDTFNGLMMLPNLLGVITLTPLVKKITDNYIRRKIKGENLKPVLSYDKKTEEKAGEEILLSG